MFKTSLSLSSSFWKSTIYNKNQCIREYINKRLLCSVIENGDNVIYTDRWAMNFPDLKTQLTKYLNLYNKEDTFIESHLLQPLHKWGRMNVEGQLSLSVLQRATRHTLADTYYKDIDMVNAEPKAFYEMLKQYGVSTSILEILKDYCENRKQRITEIIEYYNLPDITLAGKIIMTKEERVKKWFLSIFNGGDLNTIIANNDLNNYRIDTNPYLLNFWDKYAEIIDIIYTPNRHIYDDYCESKCEDTSTYTEIEIKRKIVAFVYQTLERKIQETAIIHLVENKGLILEEIIPSQDGFMVRRGLWRDEFITDIENAINSKFGFSIPFKVKDFDEKFTIDLLDNDLYDDFINNTNHEYYANNDIEASELVFEKIKKNLCSCDGRLYYKSGNIWIYGARVEDYIKTIIKNMNIHKRKLVCGKDGVERYVITEFAQKNSIIDSVYKVLMIGLLDKVKDPLFYNKLHTSNRGKFAFIDGVLDYATNKFYNWNSPELKEYYTTIIINRPFRAYFENPDRIMIEKIKTDIFESLVGRDDINLFLQFLSRAVSGFCLDKNLANYMGNRDCGKGVIYELLKAYEAYVGPFDINNLLCSRQSKDGREPERERAWLVSLEFIRLAISQETDEADPTTGKMAENKKINNKAMKSFQSGFDNITAREAYGKVINFNIDATALILGNYDIEFSGSKDGEQHLIKFSGANTYITEEQYDIKLAEKGPIYMGTYRKRDDDLYKKINANYEYKNAVIMLLLENFINKPCSQIRDADIDEEGRVVSTNCRDRIFDFYEITGNQTDMVGKDLLHSLIGGDKKKVICELKSLGCIGKAHLRMYINEEHIDEYGDTINTSKRVSVYMGLKLKPEEV